MITVPTNAIENEISAAKIAFGSSSRPNFVSPWLPARIRAAPEANRSALRNAARYTPGDHDKRMTPATVRAVPSPIPRVRVSPKHTTAIAAANSGAVAPKVAETVAPARSFAS